eukprot:2371391-Pyramimonas_sp.AAC.1
MMWPSPPTTCTVCGRSSPRLGVSSFGGSGERCVGSWASLAREGRTSRPSLSPPRDRLGAPG